MIVHVLRKPLAQGLTVANNALAHGAGALNIDACRIGFVKRVPRSISQHPSGIAAAGRKIQTGTESGHDPNVGRWPANLILSHLPECEQVGQCAEGCPVARLDGQTGILTSGEVKAGYMRNNSKNASGGGFGGGFGDMPLTGYGDVGGASRFFIQTNGGHSRK